MSVEERTSVLARLCAHNLEACRVVAATRNDGAAFLLRSGSRRASGGCLPCVLAKVCYEGFSLKGGMAVRVGDLLAKEVKYLGNAGISVLVLDREPTRLVREAADLKGIQLVVM